MLRHRSHLTATVHRVQDLIDSRFAERLPLADLAAASEVSQRTPPAASPSLNHGQVSTWMFFASHMSVRTFGQTDTVTSPSCALRSRRSEEHTSELQSL